MLMASLSSGATAGRYVGYTSSTFAPPNLPDVYAACQADFGDGAIMCTSGEFQASPSLAGASIPSSLWVLPAAPQAQSFLNSGQPSNYYDGLCATNKDYGLGVRATGQLTIVACATAIPAACCR
tara:strand:+ start:397 stop:768 length:372 start_codon:yes stop_codon:yes gene_type:complete